MPHWRVKALMSKPHEKFSWSFGEKQLELTLRIPLIPPTTQPKNSQRAFLARDGLSFKGHDMQKRHAGVISPNHAVPMINLWLNVPMRICLHKVNTGISSWRLPSTLLPRHHWVYTKMYVISHWLAVRPRVRQFPFFSLSFQICQMKC